MGLIVYYFIFFESSTCWHIHDLGWNVVAGTLPKSECIWNGVERRDFQTTDQKEVVEAGEADTGAGCLWIAPQVRWLSYSVSQEEFRLSSPLVNHTDVNAGGRAGTEGWFCYTWHTPGERYRGRHGCALTCSDGPCCAAIGREQREWKTSPSWLQDAERAAQTCSGGISLKVISRLLPPAIVERWLRGSSRETRGAQQGSCSHCLSLSWKVLPLDRDWLNYSWISSLPFIMQRRKANWHPFQLVLNGRAVADEDQDLYVYMMRVT